MTREAPGLHREGIRAVRLLTVPERVGPDEPVCRIHEGGRAGWFEDGGDGAVLGAGFIRGGV